MSNPYHELNPPVTFLKSRHEWRSDYLAKILQEAKSIGGSDGSRLLDIGAGQGKYKSLVTNLGFTYQAHDFAKFSPTPEDTNGDSEWAYTDLDYICDITELPENVADFAICTDVLEHVPDARAAAISAISALVPGGVIVFLVPQNSVMHQSPYWFSPGFSPFFFSDLGGKNSDWVELVGLYTVGNYFDFLIEEVFRPLRLGRIVPSRILHSVRRTLASLQKLIFPRLQYASSLGVIAVYRKRESKSAIAQ